MTAQITVNAVPLVAVPPGVTTLIVPVVAPAGTVAVICPSLFTVKEATTPWKVTLVAPVNPDPVITTVVPTGPTVGRNPVITGVTLNCVALVAFPPGVVTLILPVPPGGATAVICV